MLMSQSGVMDAFGEGQSPAPIVLGMFLERKCQPVASGTVWGQTGPESAWEEDARKSWSLVDGGMGSILSLWLEGFGMEQLSARNALLLPQSLFSIPG